MQDYLTEYDFMVEIQIELPVVQSSTTNPLFEKLDIARQASENFADLKSGFLEDWDFGLMIVDAVPAWFMPYHRFKWLRDGGDRLIKWLHLLKFQLCFWLNLNQFSTGDSGYVASVVNHAPKFWEIEWEEYQVGIGFRNWYCLVFLNGCH